MTYYARATEAARLFEGAGRLELARTQEIVLRHLPPGRHVVLDAGGGPGTYACWLAGLGHDVHLVDASARVGDARRLDHPDASVQTVLLLGPLYHLTEGRERLAALTEARRVLEPGGLLFAAGISRFASLLEGVRAGMFRDPAYAAIVERDLVDGQHRNPTAEDYFTTAYFHEPHELAAEVERAGFSVVELVGVEGPGWLMPDLESRWSDGRERDLLLWAARVVEREPTLLGLSPHLIVVARRPR